MLIVMTWMCYIQLFEDPTCILNPGKIFNQVNSSFSNIKILNRFNQVYSRYFSVCNAFVYVEFSNIN